jgi:predicted nucleic acid-binding protein
MRFWDSSAVLPLVIEEPTSAKMIKHFRTDPQVMAWWATPVECASAIARRERDGALRAVTATAVLKRLWRFQLGWEEVQPTTQVRTLSVRLLRAHSLRAADSMQLAAAIVASENNPATLEFVCLDKRLSAAAEREGFTVIEAE